MDFVKISGIVGIVVGILSMPVWAGVLYYLQKKESPFEDPDLEGGEWFGCAFATGFAVALWYAVLPVAITAITFYYIFLGIKKLIDNSFEKKKENFIKDNFSNTVENF